MNYVYFLGILAGVVGVLAIIPYFLSILRRKTRPNRASWLIWSFASSCLSASYYYSGARTTFWLTLSGALMAVLIFILSIKYGTGGFTRLDIICLAGSTLGLVLWAKTKNPVTALYINILVDFMAFVPTVRKAYLYPETENKLSWDIAALANLINVLALRQWKLQIALFPIYNLALNFTVAILSHGKKQKAE